MKQIEAGCLLPIMFWLLTSMPHSAQAGVKPVVNVAHVDSHFNVSASVALPLTPCNAYRLLTDYKNLPGYIPGMLQIRVKRIADNRVNIWQEGEVEVLLFRVKLVAALDMEETPWRRITFRQTEGDLESYSGEWNLLKTLQGTKVSYNAIITLKPGQLIPVFLARTVLEKEIEKRFVAIAKEASARQGRALPECGTE